MESGCRFFEVPLSNGATATYASGSSSSNLVFNYLVASGDTNSSDLSVSSLSLNGGTIVDANSQNTVNTLSSGDLGTVIVDVTTPSASTISTTASTGTYVNGDTIAIKLAFDEAVNVVTTGGIPTLTLGNGASASYTSGTGTTELTFTYTVAGGDTFDTANLSVSSVVLNGGTIKDGAGNGVTSGTSLTGVTGSTLTGVAVNATNSAPTVANAIADQSHSGSGAWSFTFASNTFSDVDGDSLTYSAALSGGSLTDWLSFDSATHWCPNV